MPSQRFRAETLIEFATALLAKAGLPTDRAQTVAETLVEGDLLGHTTHGLQLLPLYLDAIECGDIAINGEPTIVADHGSAITWDGQWLPGPWVIRQCLATAFSRINSEATVTMVVRRSGHIGCLAAYAYDAAKRGFLLLMMCSDPSVATVAPHGAIQGKMTPNPIAAGWPTEEAPILIDACPSTTTNGFAARLARNGQRLPGDWLVDSSGIPTNDPTVLNSSARGAILPLGGIELGHKGFSFGVLVEALTAGLGGFGRANETKHWGAATFMLLIDPEMFGGAAEFRRETQWLANSCRNADRRLRTEAIRMPGDRAHATRIEALEVGVALHPETMLGIEPWARKLGVKLPSPERN